MSLLSPFFLLGVLAIALPLWLHRLQTQTTEREAFSSNMLLETSKQRIHVQKKLKYLLLLALRILLLSLLALAFTRPAFLLPPESPLAEGATHHIIILDTSLSMSHDGHLETAKDRARNLIDTMPPSDQASLFTASSRFNTLAENAGNKASLKEALNSAVTDQGRLDIGAMITALNTLLDKDQGPVIIHFISDYQQSAQPLRFADLIPKAASRLDLQLNIERVNPDASPNWAVEAIVPGVNEVSVNVRGYQTQAEEKQLTLLVNGAEHDSQTLEIAAGGLGVFHFSDLALEAGDNRLEAVLSPPDALAADDRRYGVYDNSPPAPVLLLTADPESLSVTYLSAALETGPRPYQVEVVTLDDLDPRILQRYAWLLLDDLGAINDSLETALEDYLNQGGAVFAALGERSLSRSTLPISKHSLTSNPSLNASNNSSSKTITGMDSSHPVLRQASSWVNVIITRALNLTSDPADRNLIILDDQSPLLLERRLGAGRLLLLTTNLNNTWSDLPVHPVFVGFMAQAAQYLSNENPLQKAQVTHHYLQLQQTGSASGQVFDPDGNSLLSLEDTTRTQDILLKQSGFYQVFTPGGDMLIAVNPDPRESDLSAMDNQLLQNWQNAVVGGSQTAEALQSDNRADAEPVTMEIWRVLLLLLVVLTLAETLLGNRYLRFKTGTPS